MSTLSIAIDRAASSLEAVRGYAHSTLTGLTDAELMAGFHDAAELRKAVDSVLLEFSAVIATRSPRWAGRGFARQESRLCLAHRAHRRHRGNQPGRSRQGGARRRRDHPQAWPRWPAAFTVRARRRSAWCRHGDDGTR